MQRVKLTKAEIYQCLQHQRYKFYELLSKVTKPRKFTLQASLYGDCFFSAGKVQWTTVLPNQVNHWHYSFSMIQKELESSLGVENLFAEENINWKQFVLDELFIGIAKKIDKDTWIKHAQLMIDSFSSQFAFTPFL